MISTSSWTPLTIRSMETDYRTNFVSTIRTKTQRAGRKRQIEIIESAGDTTDLKDEEESWSIDRHERKENQSARLLCVRRSSEESTAELHIWTRRRAWQPRSSAERRPLCHKGALLEALTWSARARADSTRVAGKSITITLNPVQRE